MSKSHTRFACSRCGGIQPKWLGKCPDCGEWNSLSEQVVHDVAEDRHRPLVAVDEDAPLVATIDDVPPDAAHRWATGLSEFDRVLGGGLVPGSAVLIGGDPGIGKSTLLLQAGHAMAALRRKTLYITSEESLGQLRLRADRLTPPAIGALDDAVDAETAPAPRASRKPQVASPDSPEVDGASKDTIRRAHDSTLRPQDSGLKPHAPLLVSAQANLDIIANILNKERPDVVVIDSIQMVYRPDGSSAPGSAAQLRDAAARLIWMAKQMNFALLLVGHVTKDGAIAGPKILEHLVDCVIYFEGDRYHSHRLIRAVKNRFGSTDELGIFEMTGSGLLPVEDPSRLFLATQRQARPGSVVLAACEGTRTLLVEVQALTAQSVFGSAKRKATGVDSNRVAMILAVLEKHADIVLGDQDVFVNIVGGVRVTEPAADLAIALAVYGAMTRRSLPESTAVCGELGLGGELRPVHHQRQRLAEAARIGFQRFVLPSTETRDRAGSSAKSRPTGGESAPRGAQSRRADAEPALESLTCQGLADAIRHLS